MPWKLTAISDDRKTITVVFVAGDGSCVVHSGYSIKLQGQSVVLTEYSANTGSATACPSRLLRGYETITLPVALSGSVLLLHAPASGSESLLE